MIVIVETIVYQGGHYSKWGALQQFRVNFLTLLNRFFAFARRLLIVSHNLIVHTLLIFVNLDSPQELVMLSLAPLRPYKVTPARELLIGEHLVFRDAIG